jgi:hypothetical protein
METNTMSTGSTGYACAVVPVPVSAFAGTAVVRGRALLLGGVSTVTGRVRIAGVRRVEEQKWVPLTIDSPLSHKSTGVSVPGQLHRHRT